MQRLDLFVTPVTIFDLPEAVPLNAELTRRLLEEERSSPGLQRSNYGGWHSPMDLMARPEESFQGVIRLVRESVDRMAAHLGGGGLRHRIVHAWSMIMRKGDYTLAHDHGEADWSAVYYIDAGDGPPSGDLIFDDPRVGPRRRHSPHLAATHGLSPRAGHLVVFPGWLRHQVQPYEGERPRISLAANLIVV